MKRTGDQKDVHVAFFLPSLGGGGAERVILNLSEWFVKNGIKVDLVVARLQGELVTDISEGINVVDLRAKRLLFALGKLSRYVRANKPGYLLSTLDLANLIAILAVKLLRLSPKVCVVLAADLPNWRFWQIKKRLEKWLLIKTYPFADKIISMSKGTAQNLAEHSLVAYNDIAVIYNPVIDNSIERAIKEPVAFAGFDIDNTPYILGVGRLAPAKEFSTLIKAFSVVRKQVDVKLLILGEGQLRGDLEELVRKLGLEHDVYLPGFVRNPFPYMKNASVFALTSNWEGLGNVIIEAMACGCPVVATDCKSGPRELLNDGEYGYLVPVGDVEAVAHAILRVLVEGDATGAPAQWLEQFQTDVVAEKYLSEFLAL